MHCGIPALTWPTGKPIATSFLILTYKIEYVTHNITSVTGTATGMGKFPHRCTYICPLQVQYMCTIWPTTASRIYVLCVSQDGNVCCTYNQTCSSSLTSNDQPASVHRPQRHHPPTLSQPDHTRPTSITSEQRQRPGRRRWHNGRTTADRRTGRTP